MKKTLLIILTALLIFATACSSGGGSTSTTTCTTQASAAATQAVTTALSETRTALPPTMVPDNLIPVGFPTDNVWHADTDYPYTSKHAGMIFSPEAGQYYMFAEDYLLCVDAQTMEVRPLCAKEGCLHNAEPELSAREACLARVPMRNASQTAFLYNGRVYVTHSLDDGYTFVLSSISEDGTDRQTILELASDLLPDTTSPTGHAGYPLIHRGRFYYTWVKPTGNNQFITELWTYLLDGSESQPQCIYRSDVTSGATIMQPRITAYGNYLYMEHYLDDGRREEWILNRPPGDWTIPGVEAGYRYTNNRIMNGNLVSTYTEESSGDWREHITIQRDADGSNTVQLDALPDVFEADDTYLYLQDQTLESPADGFLTICDHEMNPVAEISLAEYFGFDYELNGKVYEVQTQSGYSTVFHLLGGKLLIRTYESFAYAQNCLGMRYYWYYLDADEIAAGQTALHAFFSYEPFAYDHKYIAPVA